MSVLGILLGVFVGAWFFAKAVKAQTRRRQLPPGPAGWPVIGNLLEWPSKERWLKLTEWGRKYGDLTYVNLAGSDVVVVNSLSAVNKLFSEQGGNFSDRPSLRFLCEIVGWKDLPALMNLGPEHAAHRKLLAKAIGNKTSMEELAPGITKQVARGISRLINEPQRLKHHMRTVASGIILSVSHGYDVETADDELVLLAEKMNHGLTQAFAPGAFLVDFIPAMNLIPAWAPGGGFKTTGAEMRADRQRFMDEPFDFVIREMAAGRARGSYTATQLAGKGELTREEELFIKWGATLVYLSGSDTSASAMESFVLCMLLHPDTQKRAQAELDSVVGVNHLASLKDRPRLPYVEACIKETWRWGLIAPEGLAHTARDDAMYDGYLIPKGTMLIPNVWSFANDPSVYSNPSQFRPERFLGHSPEPDPNFAFGFGRRACPGQLLAESEIFLFVVNILGMCDIVPAKGPDGRDIVVKPEYVGQSTMQPKPFSCKIQFRSQAREVMLDAALSA